MSILLLLKSGYFFKSLIIKIYIYLYKYKDYIYNGFNNSIDAFKLSC